MTLRVAKLSGATIALVMALMVIVGPLKLISYFGSAGRDVANGIEDHLVPFDWKIDYEAQAIEQMAYQRQAMKLDAEGLVKLRDDHVRQLQARKADHDKIRASMLNAGLILVAMDTGAEEARLMSGRRVPRSELRQREAQLRADTERARAALAQHEGRIQRLDSEIAKTNAAINQLAMAEASRREDLALRVLDNKVLDCALASARTRIQARGMLDPGERAAALDRALNGKRVELSVLQERLGAETAPSAYALSTDAIDSAAAELAK